MSTPATVGIVLAGATTEGATVDLIKDYEKKLVVGQYLILKDSHTGNRLLAKLTQITPEHEFYRRGDSWSATRREGRSLPSEIGMQYVSCGVEILGELSSDGSLTRSRRSPGPGSEVYLADDDTLKRIFSSAGDSDEPVVKFANLFNYKDVPIALRLNHVTEHIGVFGKTGSGKSFLIGALIEAFENIISDNHRYCYPIIVIDLHGDYTNITQSPEFPGKVYSLNPPTEARGVTTFRIDLDKMTPSNMAELIIKFYSGEITEASAKQVEGLRRAIALCEKDGINKNMQITTHIENLISKIGQLVVDEEIHRLSAGAIERASRMFYRRIARFVGPFDYENWLDGITKEGGLHILDLSVWGSPGVDIVIKQLVVGHLAHIIFDWFSKQRERYLLFVLEEAQNFCPDIAKYKIGQPALSKDKIATIAIQGRKFGASLCLASQRPGFMDKAVISQCNTFFIKRISPEDKGYVQSVTGGLPEDYARRITNIDRDEVIISGTMLTADFPIVAHIDRSHRRTPHGIGEVKPLQSFKTTQPGMEPLARRELSE